MPEYKLIFPIEPYELEDGVYRFGMRVRSRKIFWARHLGDDLVVSPGTLVRAIGEGEVVWAGIREGTSQKRNWGGLVVIKHSDFYSVYGHMKNLRVKVEGRVEGGDKIGEVAEGNTAENGWWKIPHLHFAIYLGPWTGEILPGYKRPFDGRTKFSWWRDPKSFIEEYNQSR